jgi:hypothetical protein
LWKYDVLGFEFCCCDDEKDERKEEGVDGEMGGVEARRASEGY